MDIEVGFYAHRMQVAHAGRGPCMHIFFGLHVHGDHRAQELDAPDECGVPARPCALAPSTAAMAVSD